jgi:CRISPR-associated protein Cas2
MFDRLNKYRIMWLFTIYDLPTETAGERREFARFRKLLQKDGFSMLQYSVYARHCSSRENGEVHKKRVKNGLPEKGEIMILELTDAQFERIEFFKGIKKKHRPDTPQQLELF